MNTEQKRSLIGLAYLLLKVLSAIVRKRVERRLKKGTEKPDEPEEAEETEVPKESEKEKK